MKKIYTIIILLLMALMANATKVNGISYHLDSSTKTAEVISDYYSGNINIPSVVTYKGVNYKVTSINEWAFSYYECPDLISVNIPNSVTNIGQYAFAGCHGLKSVTIGNGLEAIEDYVFMDCTSLTSITIPNSVTSICLQAFSHCTSLTSIDIPNSVKYIDIYAFAECTSLKSVTIGNGVIGIGDNVFTYCSNLTSIKVDAKNSKYDSRNNCNAIIETATNRLIIGCKNTTIPNSVTSIGNYAFEECTMTSINIPNSVTSIGYGAFSYCTSLMSVIIENPTPPSIYDSTFEECDDATLCVPVGSKSAYQAADYWKDFKNIIEINITQNTLQGDMDGDGELSVMDVMKLVNIILGADIPSYKTCPDNRHPHLIDLGLPSGTKWACCNVDADKPEASGTYYAWGETTENPYYYWTTYTHCDGKQNNCHNLGSDISGTQYDVAHVKWGGKWQMPTLEQIKELFNNCASEWTTLNGVKGRKLTSKKNGGSIFLPVTGYRWEGKLEESDTDGYYWTSTQSTTYNNCAYGIDSNSSELVWYDAYRTSGQPVRPVFQEQ